MRLYECTLALPGAPWKPLALAPSPSFVLYARDSGEAHRDRLARDERDKGQSLTPTLSPEGWGLFLVILMRLVVIEMDRTVEEARLPIDVW